MCWIGWDLVWPLLKAQQGYSETKEKSVSKSNPQSANLHVWYICLNHNWYVLTKNHFHYIFHQPHPESYANKRVSRNLLKICGTSQNSAREVLKFYVNCIVAYSKASIRFECCFNAMDAPLEFSSDDSLSPSKSKTCIRNPTVCNCWLCDGGGGYRH